MENSNTTHEEDVTTSLRMNEHAKTMMAIPMFVFLVTIVFVPIIFRLGVSGMWLATIVTVASILLLLTTIPFVKATASARAFDKNHKAAHKDGQDYINGQAFANRSIFNDTVTLVKRLYRKR